MTVHGFRVGKRHTLIPCERVPSGRHRWMGDEDCRRCGRNYYEVTKNWTGAEVRRKRKEPERQRQIAELRRRIGG